MEKHDVVVIGGGHNGLVAAAYLARAGLDVCVVEEQDRCGGGVATKELTLPGFKHDPFSIIHGFIQSNPILAQDELGLISKYGLKYIHPNPGKAFVFPDDRALILYHDIDRTCQSISQFSHKDAEAYCRLLNTAKDMAPIMTGMYTVPPSFGNMVSFLEASELGREYLRIINANVWEIAEELFESEEMRAVLIRSASEIMIPPYQNGTGMFALAFAAEAYEAMLPVGGSGTLTDVLIACLRDNGGTIKVSSAAKDVKIEAGEAKGVVLKTGEEIKATKAVISTINVKQLFLEILKPNELPAGFPERVKRLKQSYYSLLKQDIALNEAPKYKAGGDVDKSFFVRIVPVGEDLLRLYQEFAHGIPQKIEAVSSTPTIFDPTRAPENKHTLYLIHQEPYYLKGGEGRWDEIKQTLADECLETVRKHTTNMGPENVLGRSVISPLDYERLNRSWIAGDFNHIDVSLSQLFGNRPLSGWSQYRTPLKKLYICGPSTHPGPAVNAASRAAMPVILEELGIDFKKVIAK